MEHRRPPRAFWGAASRWGRLGHVIEGTAGAESPPFDRQEVRRLIAVSFSIGELSRFGEALGVHLARTGSVDDAARQLIKAVEGKRDERRLLLRLAEAKPLVVWPAPPAAHPKPPPEAPATEVEAKPREAEAPGPTVFQAPVDARRAAPAPLVDPYLYTLADEPEEATRSPWLLPVIVSITLVVGVVAGVVIALWQMNETASMPAPPETPAASVSTLAADMLDTSVAQVAEACEVKREPGESARSVLANAFRSCRKRENRPRSKTLIPPAPRPIPSPPPSGGRPTSTPRPSQQRTTTGACLDRCHRAYVQCQQERCGPEPRSAKAYPEWQRCKQGCMPAFGSCRSRCL